MKQHSEVAFTETSCDIMPPSLTEDGFLGGRIKVLQPEKGYRAGTDAVFLASTIPMEPGQTAFEAGFGVGVVSLCLAARVAGVHITGVEIIAHNSILGKQNIKQNNLAGNIEVITGDVRNATRKARGQWPRTDTFNHVYANPPFFDEDKVTRSPLALRSAAHCFKFQDLEIWVKVMAAMAMPGGTVTMVHRADSLARILAAFTAVKLGAIHVAPLYTREGSPASRVIVQAIKASRAPLQMLPGLVMHDESNSFTQAASSIMRDASAYLLR